MGEHTEKFFLGSGGSIRLDARCPQVLIGLPAVAMLDVLLRGDHNHAEGAEEHNDELNDLNVPELMSALRVVSGRVVLGCGVIFTDADRPRGEFPDEVWQKLMDARASLLDFLEQWFPDELSDGSQSRAIEKLRKLRLRLLSGGAELDDLPDKLCRELRGQEEDRNDANDDVEGKAKTLDVAENTAEDVDHSADGGKALDEVFKAVMSIAFRVGKQKMFKQYFSSQVVGRLLLDDVSGRQS